MDSIASGNGKRLLFVHGRGFKPGHEALHDLSRSALHAGIARDFPDALDALEQAACESVYYGDLTAPLLEAAGASYDAALDLADRQHALQALREIPARKRFGIRQYDCLPGKSAFREFLADLAAPVLSGAGLWMWLCERYSADFAAYLRAETDYAGAVRSRLREQLFAALDSGDEIALLAHGTGSVVAWDVLWELSHDDNYRAVADGRKVDLFVTLGSPLSDAEVQKRIAGAGRPGTGRYPANILRWCNVSAEDDYTCHDKSVADDFGKMMHTRLISSINDFAIYNHAVRYGRSNPHSSVGYYVHPRVSKIIADWLQNSS